MGFVNSSHCICNLVFRKDSPRIDFDKILPCVENSKSSIETLPA